MRLKTWKQINVVSGPRPQSQRSLWYQPPREAQRRRPKRPRNLKLSTATREHPSCPKHPTIHAHHRNTRVSHRRALYPQTGGFRGEVRGHRDRSRKRFAQNDFVWIKQTLKACEESRRTLESGAQSKDKWLPFSAALSDFSFVWRRHGNPRLRLAVGENWRLCSGNMQYPRFNLNFYHFRNSTPTDFWWFGRRFLTDGGEQRRQATFVRCIFKCSKATNRSGRYTNGTHSNRRRVFSNEY